MIRILTATATGSISLEVEAGPSTGHRVPAASPP